MKKKLETVFKQEADVEVIEAFVYYEEQLDGLGEQFLDELDSVILSIKKAPNGFIKFHDYRQVPMRVFPYVIVYEVIDQNLVVYAVFQTEQHPDKKIR